MLGKTNKAILCGVVTVGLLAPLTAFSGQAYESWTGTPAVAATTAAPSVDSYTTTWTSTGVTLNAVVKDVSGPVTLRASASALTGQTGFYTYAYPDASGNVSLKLTKFTNTSARYWQLETGSGQKYGSVLASGQVSSADPTDVKTVPAPTPAPTTEPTAPTTEPTATPEPTPTSDPTVAPGVVSYTATHTVKGMIFEGQTDGLSGKTLTLRASASPISGQAGFYEQATPDATGKVRIEIADFANANKRYWQLEDGGTASTYGTVVARGEVSAPVVEDQGPVVVPGESVMTGGSGGAKVNATFQTFKSNGVSSRYHIYASHIDTSKKVGMLVYGDGSGESGLKSPSSSYLMAGPNGLIETAKKHNMILVTPMAPGSGCPDGEGVCWYQTSSGISPETKARWANDLIQNLYTKYNVDKSRVALGGYSSGAQLVSQYLAPGHGTKLMTDGVVVPISYGGAPKITTTFTQSYKDNVVFSWDTGDADESYNSSIYGVLGGKNWYDAEGFQTQMEVIAGKGHARNGEFGGIMDREIAEHIKPS